MANHVTAIVSEKAKIDPSVEIGPYAIIEENVTIGANCKIGAHVVIKQHTSLGCGNIVHTGAVLGDTPQDLDFDGKPSYVKIGDNNVIREHVTIHRGTSPESVTSVGSNCFLMVNSHVAHNCELADGVILANGALLAGYVSLGEKAIISGNAVIHQFTRVGKLAMLSGGSQLSMDLPCFSMGANRNSCVGINRVGMKRAGYSSKEIMDVRNTYRRLYTSGVAFGKVITELETANLSSAASEMLEFIKMKSKRGVVGPARGMRNKGTSNGDGE